MSNGHATQAEVLLRQALEIFQRIGAAEARDLLAEVNALTDPLTVPSPTVCAAFDAPPEPQPRPPVPPDPRPCDQQKTPQQTKS
jgi:hypothetical protein